MLTQTYRSILHSMILFSCPWDWRLQGILFLSCLSFHKSVWNFNLANNFWTMKTRALIFHMGIPSCKTFQRVPTSFTLWPWPWSLNFFQKTLTLLINFEQWVFIFRAFIFHMSILCYKNSPWVPTILTL